MKECRHAGPERMSRFGAHRTCALIHGIAGVRPGMSAKFCSDCPGSDSGKLAAAMPRLLSDRVAQFWRMADSPVSVQAAVAELSRRAGPAAAQKALVDAVRNGYPIADAEAVAVSAGLLADSPSEASAKEGPSARA